MKIFSRKKDQEYAKKERNEVFWVLTRLRPLRIVAGKDSPGIESSDQIGFLRSFFAFLRLKNLDASALIRHALAAEDGIPSVNSIQP